MTEEWKTVPEDMPEIDDSPIREDVFAAGAKAGEEAAESTGTDLIETEEEAAGPEEEPVPPEKSNGEVFRIMIRGLAGAYIIYLAYQIMRDMIKNGNIRWYMVLASILFVAAGGFFLFTALRHFARERERNLAEARRMEKEALEREKLFAEHPERRKEYEEQERARYEAEAAARQNSRRGGLFGGLAGAQGAPAAPRSFTGSDIRERLRQMNEEDGIEVEDISADVFEDEEPT